MYFAHMYNYGQDNACIGITGILGCLGAVYVANGSMYALHVPEASKEKESEAIVTFSDWVKRQESDVGKGHGYLFVFANGSNRSNKKFATADAFAAELKKALKSPPTRLYRFDEHLGTKSETTSHADGCAIMVDRVHANSENPAGCVIWYKNANKITWVPGTVASAGYYEPRGAQYRSVVPSDVNASWWRAREDNSRIITI